MNNIVLNIPHFSSFIPEKYFNEVFLPLSKKNESNAVRLKKKINIDYELLIMTDWYTDELFETSNLTSVKAEVSRLICDIERFEKDSEEEMSKVGMGFCYTQGFDGTLIKCISDSHKNEIKAKYYIPYHEKLTIRTEEKLKKYNKVLIIDCHSFSNYKLPYQNLEIDEPFPDICLGVDSYHTSMELVDFVSTYFANKGYKVNINYPFSSTIVPLKYLYKDKRVESIMIEVNRKLYLEDDSNKKNSNFSKLKKDIQNLEALLITKHI